MNLFKDLRFNLGLPTLLPEWRKMFTTQDLLADTIAGTTVAFIAIPLSLAIALASGFPPAAGLVTAIIAGIVCAFFGGTPLAVSGPAAAMSVLIATSVESYGIPGLAMICLMAGGMQLLTGMLGIGKLGRYVPLPVIAGFTAGIGVIILVGQIPRAFGLLPPPESHTFDVINHLKAQSNNLNFVCLALVFLTIAIIRGLPKILPKVPPILPAVFVTAFIVNFFHLKNVPLIGEIPRSLPMPTLPSTSGFAIKDLLFAAFTIYLLASLETLLSSTAVDKLTQTMRHDPDQELIGQGLGNISVAMFAGIPVTGVIARSATNVRAGAKTRRSSIIHSLLILLTVFAIAPLISLIPVVALAAVLFSVAFSMINIEEFYGLWQSSRSEAFVYALTFLTIIFVDLLAGVQIGVMAACLIALINATKTNLLISSTEQDNILRLSIGGPLTFLSSSEISKIEKNIAEAREDQIILLDLTDITNLDTSGAMALVDIYKKCKERDLQFYIKGLPRRFENLIFISSGNREIEKHFLISETEVLKNSDNMQAPTAYGRLVHGVMQYYRLQKLQDKRLYDFIAKKQTPHTLFITCSDSRITPTTITNSDPGELFIIRNVGNYVPPFKLEEHTGEGAALEFALLSLNVTDIVVCGHANCGAMKACSELKNTKLPPHLQTWIEKLSQELVIDDRLNIEDIAKLNVLNQIKHLKQYPIVQELIAQDKLHLHGWFFNFNTSRVYEWNEEEKIFNQIQAVRKKTTTTDTIPSVN